VDHEACHHSYGNESSVHLCCPTAAPAVSKAIVPTFVTLGVVAFAALVIYLCTKRVHKKEKKVQAEEIENVRRAKLSLFGSTATELLKQRSTGGDEDNRNATITIAEPTPGATPPVDAFNFDSGTIASPSNPNVAAATPDVGQTDSAGNTAFGSTLERRSEADSRGAVWGAATDKSERHLVKDPPDGDGYIQVRSGSYNEAIGNRDGRASDAAGMPVRYPVDEHDTKRNRVKTERATGGVVNKFEEPGDRLQASPIGGLAPSSPRQRGGGTLDHDATMSAVDNTEPTRRASAAANPMSPSTSSSTMPSKVSPGTLLSVHRRRRGDTDGRPDSRNSGPVTLAGSTSPENEEVAGHLESEA